MSWTEYIASLYGLENHPKETRVVAVLLPILLVAGFGLIIYISF